VGWGPLDLFWSGGPLSLPKISLDYEFIPKEELTPGERLNQPLGIKYVKTPEEMRDDIRQRIKNFDPKGRCCFGSCISSFTLSHHGAGPNRLPLGSGLIFDPEYAPPYKPGPEGPHTRKRREEFLRAKEILNEISSKLCDNGKVSFVVCGAGAGDGSLQQLLQEIFGSGVKLGFPAPVK
jgi:hypothetical protein